MRTKKGMLNKDMKMLTQEGLVNEGIALDASLVSKESTYDNTTSTKQHDESSSSGYDANEKEQAVKALFDVENADVGPSFDRNTLNEVHHSDNDTLENVFVHGIQNHEQPKSISDTYVMSKNNSNIISNIPDMDPNRGKEEHDDVDNEQEHALFASLVNNLKCEVEKCTKVNREA
ncbi:hypothetical protein Tco_1395095 [Tanacetum coccineum]